MKGSYQNGKIYPSALPRMETELKLSGIPIRVGLQPNGARGVIHLIVDSLRNVFIDGYVQRIPDHDIKIVLKGTERDIQIVVTEIVKNIPDCNIETVRYCYCVSWPNVPSFKILQSASRDAVKSKLSDDCYDNKSVRSDNKSVRSHSSQH